MAMTEKIEQGLSQETIQRYHRQMMGWNVYEENLGSGFGPVDLVFIQIEPERITSRAQVQDFLHQEIEETSRDMVEGRRYIRMCNGHLSYLEATMGEKESPYLYIPKTLGIRLSPHPKTHINEINFGFSEMFANEGFANNEVGWRRYREVEPFSRAEFQKALKDARERVIPVILEAIGRTDLKLDYRMRHRNIDRPWVSRVTEGPEKFLLEVNIHERNRPRQYKGAAEPLQVHEPAHLIQALCIRDNIRRGSLSLLYGITTIPGLEQWGMEGIAQTLPFYIPEIMEGMSPYGRIALEYSYLQDLVYGNEVFIKISEGLSDDQITEYVREILPGEPIERIHYLIDLRRNNPRYGTYAHAYYASHYFREQAKLLDEQKKLQALRFIFNNPAMPEEIADYFDQLKAA